MREMVGMVAMEEVRRQPVLAVSPAMSGRPVDHSPNQGPPR